MDAPPVQYVKTTDGYDIAYATRGEGLPFVFTPPPLSHIQLMWEHWVSYPPWLAGLASRFRLIQYDARGAGMSSRGLPSDFELLDYCQDLHAVANRLHLDDFVLMATNGRCPVAVRYAIENPARVRALILASPAIEGSVWPQALWGSLAEQDWDAFLRNVAILTRAGNVDNTIERLRQTSTQDDWVTWIRALQQSDMEADLSRVKTPILVIHPRDYDTTHKQAMDVASALPNARMSTIDGSTLLGDVEQGLRAIDGFLSDLPESPSGGEETPATAQQAINSLSTRQREVLQLLGQGRSNCEIAEELVLSVRTVERHLAGLYDKIGVNNRTQAAVYAKEHGLV